MAGATAAAIGGTIITLQRLPSPSVIVLVIAGVIASAQRLRLRIGLTTVILADQAAACPQRPRHGGDGLMLAHLPYRVQIPLGLSIAVLLGALLVTVVAAQISLADPGAVRPRQREPPCARRSSRP
jgi:hypothetical protein